MATDETRATLRAKISHYWQLAPLVTDAGVRADIAKMIEELEKRLRELDPLPVSVFAAAALTLSVLGALSDTL
jgi:hypothetical protein